MLADVDVEVGVLDVHAGLDTARAERGEHLHRGVRVVDVAVEADARRELERERAVEHDGGRREAERGERLARGGRAPAGRDQHRDAAPLELGPR